MEKRMESTDRSRLCGRMRGKMSYLNFDSAYDKYPETRIAGFDDEAWSGWEQIEQTIRTAMRGKRILVVDTYPGVHDEELLAHLKAAVNPQMIIETKELFYDEEQLTKRMERYLTDDRVRGIMCYETVDAFLDPERLQVARKQVEEAEETVLVYGFAAALVSAKDVLVYADMARWEIQLRYRKGMPNYKQRNYEEDFLRKYKRGFFVEWRIADRHKNGLFDRIDFYLDTNVAEKPNMVTGKAFFAGLKQMTKTPFRLVPYFDPGVWGGQWMKEVCKLDPKEPNYAWSFDGVPEENSIYLRFADVRIESPAMNLTLYQPREFMGQKTFARFGAEFPIRFDFLDTMGGQNLSLQVHPLTEYIHKKFGMSYTQDESYYILDAGKEGGVYLGVKEGIDAKQMVEDLERAQDGSIKFDANQYINFFPAKKHDHFLIPAGTIHCSSSDCMVLEVSATPYIFTFKLWDWDRVGLDGIPRPIHVEDGKQVIQFDRDTQWVKDNLVNHFQTITENDAYTEVKTGLHELEFIETHVFTTSDHVDIMANGEFYMLNLVEGKSAVVESLDGTFDPYVVHYAETFIVPANAGSYRLRPEQAGEQIKVLRANVRY